MADKKNNAHDLEGTWIRELAGILQDTGLTEIEIEKDGIHLRVARQGVPVSAAAPIVAAPVAQSVVAQPVEAPTQPDAAASSHPGSVKSPMVGTVYLAPSPGATAFIKLGDMVKEGQTVMIVEAMKTMNPITAPRSGKVHSILVADAQPVEYDEALLIIE